MAHEFVITMKRPRRQRPLIVALYANAALLLVIIVVMLSRGSILPSARAALAPQPIAGNGNLYIMPAQLLNNVWGCYILDIENQTLCTYSYNGNQLRLIAARSIRWDHALEKFNTNPDPEEIHRLVLMQQGDQHLLAPIPHPGPATQPEANK